LRFVNVLINGSSSLEVGAESVGTVAGVRTWRQKVSDFMRCDREATSMQMEWWVDWYWRSLGNEQQCESTGGNVNMQAVSNAKHS